MPKVAHFDNILVTGGLGFIGGHLVERLLAKFPNSTLHVLDAGTYAANGSLALKLFNNPRVRIFVGDVIDQGMVKRAIEGCSHVFHTAAETHVPRSFCNENIFFQSNVVGTKIIAETANAVGVQRLVHVSTDEVYGPTFDCVTEDHGFFPSTPYAQSKADAETELAFMRELGLDICVARPTNAIGTRQHPEKVSPKFMMQALSDQPFTIEGDGMQRRCFLPVIDLADALIEIAVKSPANEVYNIAGHEELSIRELANRISHITGRSLQFQPVIDRKINDQSYSICGEKLSKLGFRQTSDVDSELKKMMNAKGEVIAWGKLPSVKNSVFSTPRLNAPSMALELEVKVEPASIHPKQQRV